ncbi:YdcH family protein [Vibrio algarum]|uniref:YdcH family protein n=1 Tax=Vibrio algarum TaxID=3020714 RepID=A0ABT4YTY1_9VIBR|nr:YdcH family protein [Vibrio sp. KJ40-1]MDB1125037.1 YdcH family protein [Vibrio sp. KJ40-1]
MLGENHSLVNEFPELKKLIAKLVESNSTFAEDTKKYDSIDNEIRTLELEDAPIIDESMHQLKHQRSVLKDSLYQRLMKSKSSNK